MEPRSSPFTVTSNVVTPNWFLLRNFSVPDDQLKNISCHIAVPEGLKMIAADGAKVTFKELPSNKPGMREYELLEVIKPGVNKLNPIQGPFYFQPIDGETKIPDEATVTLFTAVSGKESHSIDCPLKVVKIPEIPPIDALDISLAWMQDNQEREWPDFLKNFHDLGFGFVSTFPRYFVKENGVWSDDSLKSLQFLKKAKEAGFKIVYNESPFHLMEKAITKAKKDGAIDASESKDIFNQVDGKPGKWVSPLYRGKYFRDEIDRVAELVKLVDPDHIYLDIEMWDYNIREARSDPRALAAWKESRKSWEEFATDTGKESLGELGKAMREAVGDKKLVVGLYASDPTRAPLYNFYAWNKIYPETVNICMPSIYVQGRALDVAKRVRAAYDALGDRHIIPWLTAGTYGAFEPKYMEPMVLEAVLNGASGITYYWFRDFDPMHFYYHAKALSELGKYPKLIREGRPIAYQGDNPNLHYTCFASPDDALVLVGNYGRSSNGKARIPVALASINNVVDTAGNDIPIKNGFISIDVPPGEFQLFYMGQKKG